MLPSKLRPTTRKIAALVALSAFLFAGYHRSGPYRGVFGRLGGYCAGVCRADAFGLILMGDGKPGGHQYQAGIWQDERPGWLVVGVEYRDGRVSLRSWSDYWVAW